MSALQGSPLTPTLAERPPARVPPNFLVGRDREGRWVALASHGLGGGYFRSREAAIRYAATGADARPARCG